MPDFLKNFLKSPYHSRVQIFTVLGILSYLLLAINSGWGFFGVVLSPEFIYVFIFNLIVATIICSYIHEVNLWLAKQPAFKRNSVIVRTKYCFYAVVVPVLFELVVALVFFGIKTEGIVNSSYFDIDFILILTFIFALNLFYFFANSARRSVLKAMLTYHGSVRTNLREIRRLKKIVHLKLIREAPVSLVGYDMTEIGINKYHIACVYKEEDSIVTYYFDGTKTYTKQSISNIYKRLSPVDYFKINPYCIHHRLAIFEYSGADASRRTRLVLRHPFNHLVSDNQRIVSQANYMAFRNWFQE